LTTLQSIVDFKVPSFNSVEHKICQKDEGLNY
jgi:hypothetical protein